MKRRAWSIIRHLLPLLVTVAAAGVSAQAAGAPTSADATVDRGRAQFLAGRDAFESGDFERAFEHFRMAYELTGQPMLLFNMGSAEDRLRRDAEALRYFRTYLEEVPDAPNRGEVEGRIAQLERNIAERQAADARTQQELNRARDEAARAARLAVSSPPRPVAAWITTGASAIVAVTGAVLFGVGRHDVNRVENAPTGTLWTDLSAANARAPRLTGSGLALMSLGLAGTAAGITWAVVRLHRDAPTGARSAELRVGPSALVIRGRF